MRLAQSLASANPRRFNVSGQVLSQFVVPLSGTAGPVSAALTGADTGGAFASLLNGLLPSSDTASAPSVLPVATSAPGPRASSASIGPFDLASMQARPASAQVPVLSIPSLGVSSNGVPAAAAPSPPGPATGTPRPPPAPAAQGLPLTVPTPLEAAVNGTQAGTARSGELKGGASRSGGTRERLTPSGETAPLAFAPPGEIARPVVPTEQAQSPAMGGTAVPDAAPPETTQSPKTHGVARQNTARAKEPDEPIPPIASPVPVSAGSMPPEAVPAPPAGAVPPPSAFSHTNRFGQFANGLTALTRTRRTSCLTS